MKTNRLEHWSIFLLLFALALGVSAMVVSCSSSSSETPTSTRAIARPSMMPATRAPSPLPSATATSTSTPTPGALVIPTPPANGIALTLTADSRQTGWVNTQTPFTPDINLNVGVRRGETFISLVQFDATQLAPGTQVLFAALELSGRNANYLQAQGQWQLEVLDTQTSDWTNATYDTIRRAPVLFAVSTPLASNELGAGVRKRFVFSAQQRELLQKQIAVGTITLRLSGPTEGDDNAFVWDGTPGEREPRLHLVVIPAAFTVITATPTPPDVFAAATQVVAQTLQARQIGTPTRLPRALATATPLPYVVFTIAPTPVNPIEARATAAYQTAVAVTTGTATPYPPNWYTATPRPIAIPLASLTPTPTPTPTVTMWLPDLAKLPLPSVLYNKIAFLSGSRSNPTAWIMDPDGSNLAELTDRIYYDIAAAREVVSPDGAWLLYNAPDKSANQVVQIWRANLSDPKKPAEQLTFHTRGFSFAPVWSPDGSKILYTHSQNNREQEIFLYDFNDPRRWTRLSFSQEQYFWNQYPSWSPDGKQIVFCSDRGHLGAFTEIWVMNADGSGARKLGDGSRDAWAPVWIKWTR